MPPAIRRLAVPVLALGLLGALAVPSALGITLGNTINVNSLADVAANDGVCTLREAITAANTNTASGAAAGECAAGSVTGRDSIEITVDGTITLTSALPAISSDVLIAGHGASALSVNGAGITGVFDIASGISTIADLTITGGQSGSTGGGITNAGDLTVTLSTITGNSSPNGGGIFNANIGTLTVTLSTISGNAASNTGGGISNDGTLTVDRSTIRGNTAQFSGGGISNSNLLTATVAVTNSTISGNTSRAGGGIDNFGTVAVTNSTISQNAASIGGGGIFANGTETLVNDIVAGNTAPIGPDIDVVAETITTSVIGVPGGKTLADILVPGGLADNGGPTKTIALALVAGNPAIDAGTASACAAAPVNGIDQRGKLRPAACDIGAYEAQAPTIAPHANVSVAVSPPAPTVVSYTKPAGTDEQGGVLGVTCLPASGSTFAVGTTTVTCTGTDAVGHTGTGTFEVIVSAVAAPSPPAPTLPNSATAMGSSPVPGARWPIGVFGLLALVGLFGLVALRRARR
jgi:CSLREA domain-containing protein